MGMTELVDASTLDNESYSDARAPVVLRRFADENAVLDLRKNSLDSDLVRKMIVAEYAAAPP